MSDEPAGQRVEIGHLASGVPGLDQVLGGGLPEYSFNIIAGGPGTGKTTLSQQILFANASPERPALYFTVLGEPTLKMLRYQQQFSFFDPSKLDGVIHYVNLSQDVLDQDLSKVLRSIVREVEETNPGLVVVDSFRTVVRAAAALETGELALQGFVQQLALQLTSWQATTFLIGEYVESDSHDNPIFTVADGILWLHQSVDRNSMVRKLQLLKMRGQAPMPGLHTFRITGDGLQVFPRIPETREREQRAKPAARLSVGVPELDEMMGGGIPAGDSALVAGPAGSGKSALATQFIAEGVRQGQAGVIAIFEEHPADYVRRAGELGLELDEMIRQGKLHVIYLRPLDLSVDEVLQEVRDEVERLGAKRVAIDSLSGFELALAPTFRQDFRESMYRMVGALTDVGVTILMTVEVQTSFTDLKFSPHEISFLTDDLILQRYVELESQLRKVVTIVKMRSSAHRRELRAYDVTEHGLVIGQELKEYRGIITGVPQVRESSMQRVYPGVTDDEMVLLEALIELGEASAADVGRKTGLQRSVVETRLQRLVGVNYAIKVQDGNRTVYRPVARALGQ